MTPEMVGDADPPVPAIDRVVLVTGGGSGIGAATAARFTRTGAQVVITGRRPGPLAAVADEIGATALPGDMANAADAAAVVAGTLARFGRLDVLIANAGGHGVGAVLDTDDHAWRTALEANLDTAFVASRAALPALIEARGAIVVVSSVAGLFAGPEVAGYTVGKHALIGLVRSLARDYGCRGVRVNAVCPGWVRTPMADTEMAEFAEMAGLDDAEDGYRSVTADVPLGRPAEATEIASVCHFLAGPDASYVSGSVLVVDGGGHAVDLPTTAIAHALASRGDPPSNPEAS